MENPIYTAHRSEREKGLVPLAKVGKCISITGYRSRCLADDSMWDRVLYHGTKRVKYFTINS